MGSSMAVVASGDVNYGDEAIFLLIILAPH